MNSSQAESERDVILEILQGVMTTANMSELLQLVHRAISKVLYAENCIVGLVDPGTGMIHFKLHVDKFDAMPPPRRLSTKTLSAFVIRSGKPLLFRDTSDPLFRELVASGEVRLSGTDSPSWLGVPLRTPTGTIGVLVVQHYEKAGVYSEHDLELLSSIGGQIALAIERKQAEDDRARLTEQLRQALAKTTALRGLLTICRTCKRVQDDEGQWQEIEAYIRKHSLADFTPTQCGECGEGR